MSNLENEFYLNDADLIKLVDSDPSAHEGGPSELHSQLECGRRYILDRQFREDPLAENCWRRNAGSIAHKLTEFMDCGVDPAEHFTRICENAKLQESLDVAWNIAEHYAEAFPAGFWGELVEAEVKLTGSIGAGRLDRVWTVDQAAIDRIEARFAVNMNGPGTYLWDLKTSGQADKSLSTKYEWGPACYMYTNLALARWSDVRGMIFLNAVPHATKREGKWVEFAAAVYPVEGQTSDLAHRRFNHMQAQAALNTQETFSGPFGRCNTAMCYFHGLACRHRLSGACEGV